MVSVAALATAALVPPSVSRRCPAGVGEAMGRALGGLPSTHRAGWSGDRAGGPAQARNTRPVAGPLDTVPGGPRDDEADPPGAGTGKGVEHTSIPQGHRRSDG